MNNIHQSFKVVQSDGTNRKTQTFDLSEIIFAERESRPESRLTHALA